MMGSPEMRLEYELQRQRDLIREAQQARLVLESRRPTTLARIVRLVQSGAAATSKAA